MYLVIFVSNMNILSSHSNTVPWKNATVTFILHLLTP